MSWYVIQVSILKALQVRRETDVVVCKNGLNYNKNGIPSSCRAPILEWPPRWRRVFSKFGALLLHRLSIKIDVWWCLSLWSVLGPHVLPLIPSTGSKSTDREQQCWTCIYCFDKSHKLFMKYYYYYYYYNHEIDLLQQNLTQTGRNTTDTIR